MREATRRVHTAGYGVDPETGERGYLLPNGLCPARLVSMNAGSSPVTFEDRIAQYQAVATRFGIEADHVYYPGSGHDVSPTTGFPGADVTYVDVDLVAMDDLAAAGYDATWTDATGHELADGADVMVFRNAGLCEEAIVEVNLRPGGWVFANDHLESARHLQGLEQLELVGIVPQDWTGASPKVETRDLVECFSRSGQRWEGRPVPSFAKGSPLDLFLFRDDRDPGSPSEVR